MTFRRIPHPTVGLVVALALGLASAACSSVPRAAPPTTPGRSPSGSTGPPTGSPAAPSSAPSTTVPATGLPPIRHVFVIVLENEGYAATFGTPSDDPYLAGTLVGQGALLTNYYGIGHHSLDNYVALLSGQAPNPDTQGDCQDYVDFPPAATVLPGGQLTDSGCVYPTSVSTVANQLDAAHRTWKGYMQDMGDIASRESAVCGHPVIGTPDGTEDAPDAGIERHRIGQGTLAAQSVAAGPIGQKRHLTRLRNSGPQNGRYHRMDGIVRRGGLGGGCRKQGLAAIQQQTGLQGRHLIGDRDIGRHGLDGDAGRRLRAQGVRGGGEGGPPPDAPLPPGVKSTFVHLGNGEPAVLYEPVNPGPKAQIAVFTMHSAGDELTTSTCTELSKRGYRVFCVNNSNDKSRNFNDGVLDQVNLETKKAVAFLRKYPGVTKIVLWGHSGGSTVAFVEASIRLAEADDPQGRLVARANSTYVFRPRE